MCCSSADEASSKCFRSLHNHSIGKSPWNLCEFGRDTSSMELHIVNTIYTYHALRAYWFLHVHIDQGLSDSVIACRCWILSMARAMCCPHLNHSASWHLFFSTSILFIQAHVNIERTHSPSEADIRRVAGALSIKLNVVFMLKPVAVFSLASIWSVAV